MYVTLIDEAIKNKEDIETDDATKQAIAAARNRFKIITPGVAGLLPREQGLAVPQPMLPQMPTSTLMNNIFVTPQKMQENLVPLGHHFDVCKDESMVMEGNADNIYKWADVGNNTSCYDGDGKDLEDEFEDLSDQFMLGKLPVDTDSPTSETCVLTKALENTFFQNNTNVLGQDTPNKEPMESPDHGASVVTVETHVTDAAVGMGTNIVASITGKNTSPYTPVRGKFVSSPPEHANESSCPPQDALDMLAYAAESTLSPYVVTPAVTKYINYGKESENQDNTFPNCSNMGEGDNVHQTRNDIVSTLSYCFCLLM